MYLGVISINGGLNVIGSPVTLQSIGRSFSEASTSKTVNGVQVASIDVYATKYEPNYLKFQAGVPVRLALTTKGALGCTSIFRIPALGIQTSLQQKDQIIEFTPNKQGKITFTCGMGMYSGVMDIT